MNLLNVATLGVRLTGVAVISLALLLGGNVAVDQIAKGSQSHRETRVEANTTTITTTVTTRSFGPLLLAPVGAGLALGLLLILGSRPIARIVILGFDEQENVQLPDCTEPRDSSQGANRMPQPRGR
jgi:hypothetical protein